MDDAIHWLHPHLVDDVVHCHAPTPLRHDDPLVIGGAHLGQPHVLGGGALCIHPLPIAMAQAPAFHNLDPLELILTPSSHPTLLCLITCLALGHPPPCNSITHHRHRRQNTYHSTNRDTW